MKTIPQRYEKITKDFSGLIPPKSHKFSLASKSGLVNITNTVAKYAPKISISSLINQHAGVFDPPYRQPQFGEFLIFARTLHSQEPIGTFLFTFKQQEAVGENVDIIFSPVSLFKVSRLQEESGPNTYRMANIWYEQETDILQSVPNIQELFDNGTFHKHLTPVGPLVQNVNSTYLNKVVSVVRGEVLTKRTPRENVKLLLPADLYFNLDESLFPHLIDKEPSHLNVFYYACITYTRVFDQPAASVMFFRTSKGLCEVMMQLKLFFSNLITNRLAYGEAGQLNIKRVNLGALCKVGYSSAQTQPNQKSVLIRGAAFSVVEIPDFITDPGSWVSLI
ncbi:ORF62 [Felid gammaherpesvirus 1]|uniref:ORF62 n=1 Tax=Felid gammaherpesvirus 1 TaxID=2560468 RepID=A0A0M5L637_9GAMA|nr:ORF62 [Felis catus gammaherpesvirus 1]ALE14777.1 ORF62 [Felis catus gammaherpesvirus 1]